MHTYILRNNGNQSIEVTSDDLLIVKMEPNSSICFVSPFGDLEPLFLSEGVDCEVGPCVEISSDFLSKCQKSEKEIFLWKEEGF